ncbi:unnamed protein product [Paramecium sonneborni]|uniref:RRM domain-containing protein n=1 Tax=Paramecium sonneborni TaxID=65129 RepID=A0A8S1PL27_9CILI|nr:unnamed protein product [Paramecium sonneborni]
MPPKGNQIHVSNIQSLAKNEEVQQLLSSIGPLVEWIPKREGEVKFSCIAEYYDEFTAHIAVETLNGYKFQGRELKVKLHTNISTYKILPYAIEKVNYKTSNTYSMNLPLEEFYTTLTTTKKLAILIDLKQAFFNKDDLLEKLLRDNPRMTDFILKIQKDVIKEFKTNNTNNDDISHNNHYQQFQVYSNLFLESPKILMNHILKTLFVGQHSFIKQYQNSTQNKRWQ